MRTRKQPDPLQAEPATPPDSSPRLSLALRIFRWISRFAALLVGVTLLVILFASREQPKGSEWLGVAFFPIGVALSLLLGLWRELLGGVLALLSLTTFYIMFIVVGKTVPHGPYFAVLSSPALLQITSGLLSRGARR